MSHLDWLPTELPRREVGGKARGLSELLRWGFPVPPGFVVRASALADFTDGAPLPDALEAALRAAAATLGPGPWAVRSSGASEDSAEHSFAGVHETILGVERADALLEAVRRCRASADSARARAYRERRGVEANPAPLAVVVQRQLTPTFAGVAFSLDPVKGDRSRLVIEAVEGLGEALVSGHVTPSRAVVSRAGEVLEQSTPPGGRELPAALAVEVARRTLEVEAKAGGPVDIEWAVEQGQLWLLQWRPVTTAPAPGTGEAGRRTVWTNTNAAEILPGLAKPLVHDLIRRYVQSLLSPVLEPFGLTSETLGVFGLVKGRVYFNVNALLGWARAMPIAGRQDISAMAKGLGGDQEAFAAALRLLRPEDLPTHRLSLWTMAKGSAHIALQLFQNRSADASDAVAELRVSNERLASVDVSSLDDAALAAYLAGATENAFGPRVRQTMFASAWGMMGMAVLPALTARWLDDPHGALARRLLQGMGGLDSAAAGLALGQLGDEVRRAGLSEALDGDWPTVRARLSGAEAGRAFLLNFEAFLARHGHHARGEADASTPRWSEEPDYVLRQIRFAAQGTAPAPLDSAGREAGRTAMVAECCARLGPLRRRVFRFVVDRTARGIAARENNKSEAVRRVAFCRRAILEIARRLGERGSLSARDDVWYLDWEALYGALLGRLSKEAVVAAVKEQKQQYATWERENPPPVLIEGARLELSRAAPTSAVLEGIAASPGVVEGIARVVLHADDQVGVRPGEVLVAPHTDPGWTPYFLHAAAVVTDFGGLLSHGAVVAREYGLPAVVNVGTATSRIVDGQRVRVDGTLGRVELLEPKAHSS